MVRVRLIKKDKNNPRKVIGIGRLVKKKGSKERTKKQLNSIRKKMSVYV